MREAVLAASRNDGLFTQTAIYGVLSLILWALILVVTVKYVLVLLNADNKGEGGTLSLMALAQRVLGSKLVVVPVLAMVGAALFYGDAMITPAISVLSAIEGIDVVTPHLHHYVLPITIGIIIALFLVQARGTASVASLFGPVTLLWFVAIGLAGIPHIIQDPALLTAINPIYAVEFLATNGIVGLFTLGAVFLAVTGAEALYADLGHFGQTADPVRLALRCASRARAQLSGPGGASADNAGSDQQSFLPDGAQVGADPHGGARHRRHHHRQPGSDHRCLFDDQASDPAWPLAAPGNPLHIRVPRRPSLPTASQLVLTCRRARTGTRLP